MKKILLVLLTISASLSFKFGHAQACGGINDCTAGPNTQVGFPDPDSIPCAVQGQPYSYSIPFKLYDQFNYLGSHYIDSITFDTIFNLPYGLCYTFSKASGTYDSSEIGCVKITGTTCDSVGQYNLAISVTAYLSGDQGIGEPIPPATVDSAGIIVWFRVASASGQCTATDQQPDAYSHTAATSAPLCPTGINEVAANVATVNISPNPFSSSSQLTFTVEKNANYAIKVTDVTGRVLSVKQIQALPGENSYTIERGSLSSGMYLLSLSDGASSVTRKFTIIE